MQLMADCWADCGYSVAVAGELNETTDADIALLHVNLTHVPLTYSRSAQSFPVVINGHTSSISKELFSNQILDKLSEYKGKVIVKTKENYGGLPELRRAELSKMERTLIKKAKTILASRALNNRFLMSYIWRKTRVLDPSQYPIFESIREVPLGVWKNRHLIVEKFLPEQDADGRYVLRHWYFFGNKEFTRTLSSSNPIVKWCSMNNDERTRSLEEWWKINVVTNDKVPQEVRAVRKKLRMDFGRIDWAIHDGKPIVFDANKTPAGIGVAALCSGIAVKRRSLLCEFAAGIEYFNL
jgi:hypothetical protein